ncbi:MAG: Asp-tRNA(Asn)/Glu-tRNA(Gln) amidotransferase subunit GatC [Alphaproteobacteria bacterium]|nr:Asp-tRNA(Asn)/Glu-tRNA(Gln) amidotransferase subunit GatC [Alphaproteobacteria bacterium]
MALTDKEVHHIATLARIRLSADELPHYAKEINGILKWIAQLDEVNTEGVAALSSVSEQLLPWRADVVNDGNRQEAVLKNAPMQQYGCFAVPKVIE